MRDPRPVHMIDCPSTGEQRPVDDCKQFGTPLPSHNPIAVQQWRDCQSCDHCRNADGELIRVVAENGEWSGAVSRERWEALKTSLILAYRDGLKPERITRDLPQIDLRWMELFAGNEQVVRMNRPRDYPDEPTRFEVNVGRLEAYISEFRTGKANGLPGTVVTSVTRAFIAAAELARATGGIVLFDAAPGLGKTKGADYYLAQTRIAEGIGCPVWKIKLDPNGVSPLFVLRQIADEIIGGGKYDRRNAPEIANAIHAKAAGSRGLLIVDEAQELAKEPITGPKLLNTLRRFADEDTHCFGIMLMANGEIYHRYGQNEKFTQLYSRVHKRIEVFGLNDADEAARRTPPAPALQVADVRAIAAQWGIEDPEVIAWCVREAAKPGALRHLDKRLRGVLDDWGEITRASLQLAGVWS